MQNTEIIIDCDAPVFVSDGWSVAPDSEQLPNRVRGQFKWDPSKINLYLSDKQKEGKWIEGNKLREELKKEKVLPAQILDYLLKPENKHLIPEEWKNKSVFFWGTIYRDSGGGFCVRCLWWDGVGWGWGCRWRGSVWRGRNSSACSQV